MSRLVAAPMFALAPSWFARAWRYRRIRLSALGVAAIGALLLTPWLWPAAPWLEVVGLGGAPPVLALIFFAALACELIDSSIGMGYGTTLAPVLLLAGYSPHEIVPAILLSECVTGLLSGWLHHRDGNVDFLRDPRARGLVLFFLGATLVGTLGAVAVARVISPARLSALIAVIVIAVGLLLIFTMRRRLAFRPAQLGFVGLLAAFNKAVSGGGYGPLVTAGQVVSGVPARHAVAIGSMSEGLACLLGLGAYLALQQTPALVLALPLVAGGVLSVPLATLLVRRLPEQALRGAVGVATLLLGTLALIKALAA